MAHIPNKLPIKEPKVESVDVLESTWDEFFAAGGVFVDEQDTKPIPFVESAYDDLRDVDL